MGLSFHSCCISDSMSKKHTKISFVNVCQCESVTEETYRTPREVAYMLASEVFTVDKLRSLYLLTVIRE